MKLLFQTSCKRTLSDRTNGNAIRRDAVRPRRLLQLPGVEFIDENGGGPGVRLRKRQRAKHSK